MGKGNRVYKSSEEGQSIVQAVIGLGLVSALALMYAQMNTSAMRAQQTFRIVSDFNNFSELITATLAQPFVCKKNVLETGNLSTLTFKANFNSNTDTPISVKKVILPNNAVIATAPEGSNLGTPIAPGMTIQKLEIIPYQELAIGKSFIADLRITAKKPTGAIGSPTISKDIRIILGTNATGIHRTITDCGVAAALSEPPGVLKGYCAEAEHAKYCDPSRETSPAYCTNTDPGAIDGNYCACMPGYSRIWVGVCNIGECVDGTWAWNVEQKPVYFFVCKKD
ncbi:MAG: hypothetical protein A2428_17580 [Bdellovibrionales bacterium RIFOXYC1_FULL_54_43]|nr:MAG: hypothetical protein A2428_17580 [Bdellovibrionales bacterium RIFOXYC1_FULL_54_43]OFZ83542.1 MAG: hypothetical protein A2603_14885 [Bdellovibrionales bacterium RIFOXYD1_FULL_55_31]